MKILLTKAELAAIPNACRTCAACVRFRAARGKLTCHHMGCIGCDPAIRAELDRAFAPAPKGWLAGIEVVL